MWIWVFYPLTSYSFMIKNLNKEVISPALSIWQYLDWALVICVVSIVFVGRELENVVLVLTVLPILLARNFSANYEALHGHLPFIVLCAQYSIFHLLKIAFWDGQPSGELYDNYPVEAEKWIWGLVLVPLLTVRFISMDNLVVLFHRIAPPLMLFLFLCMSVRYFTPYFEDTTRIKNLAANVFISPLYFTIFAILLFSGDHLGLKSERMIRYAVLVSSIILATAYAGTRGIFIGQLVSYLALAGIFFIIHEENRKVSLSILCSIVIGVLLGFFIDLCRDGSFCERYLLLFDVIQFTSEGEEALSASMSGRSSLYQLGFERILEHPIVGYGIAHEPIIAGRFYHMHNMYISWMLWGGFFSLVSGLLFLLATGCASFIKSKGVNTYIIGLSILGPLSISMLFDSFLFWKHFYLLSILTMSFAYSLGVAERRIVKDKHISYDD